MGKMYPALRNTGRYGYKKGALLDSASAIARRCTQVRTNRHDTLLRFQSSSAFGIQIPVTGSQSR